MFARAISITVGVALLAAGTPITAQQRGTVEFGGFAAGTSFDNSLGMNNNWGAGARIGAFLFPRLSVEFEAGGSSAGRTLGRADVNVGVLSARLTGVPLKFGRVSVLAGVGADHTDADFLESYGVHGLLGAKFALTESVALRVDGLRSYMINGDGWNDGLHLGLSVYRGPSHTTNTVTRTVTMTAPPRPDSVSAAETRRLRAVEARYDALRDSLERPSSPAAASAAERLTMMETVHFQHDRSDLSEAAKALLRDKISVFRAYPSMRITIVGFASKPGTETYNMALGLRRAESARAYLISQGIPQSRIEIATRGEGQRVLEGSSEIANAANRRGEFWILVADLAASRD